VWDWIYVVQDKCHRWAVENVTEGGQLYLKAMPMKCNAIKILHTSPIKFIKGRSLKPRSHVDGLEIKREKHKMKIMIGNNFQQNVKVDWTALQLEFRRS
jgi:hypothetical protein